MRNRITFVLVNVFLTIFFSCEKQNRKTVLSFVPEESISSNISIHEAPVSISIIPHGSDSIEIRLDGKNDVFWRTLFLKKNNAIYEVRKIFTTDEIPGKLLGYDYIEALVRKDTAFCYKSKMDFIPRGMGLSMDDSNYTIRKLEKGYVSIKQSAVIPTLREIYFYDEDYNIYKYIFTRNNSMYVYAKR